MRRKVLHGIYGLKNALCDHLQEVNESAVIFPTKVVLDETVLYSMASNIEDGECILKDYLCCELNNLAVVNECVPVVPLENNRYVNLSVFSDKVYYKTNLWRFVVSYNTKCRTLDCGHWIVVVVYEKLVAFIKQWHCGS